MLGNRTRAKLTDGKPVLGCFLRYPDAGVVELLALQGFDFVVLDGEHGTLDPARCEHMVRAAELRGITPLVRVPAGDTVAIPRYMDTGPHGCHVPLVNSPSEAEDAVGAIKYPPRGRRGLAAVRAADFGQTDPFDRYVEHANRETLVVAHVETEEAVLASGAIAEVHDVDVVYVGPTDLSQSFGVPGNPADARVQQAIDHVIASVSAAGKTCGITVGDASEAEHFIGRGVHYIGVSFESIVRTGSRQYAGLTS